MRVPGHTWDIDEPTGGLAWLQRLCQWWISARALHASSPTAFNDIWEARRERFTPPTTASALDHMTGQGRVLITATFMGSRV